jgi:ribosomal protein S18 acetylase RimI-like enzyme
MRHVEEAMAAVHRASYVSLHVRKSNRAALGLYRDTLGFTVNTIEKGYCESSCLRCLVRTVDFRVQMRMGRTLTQCR